MKFGHFDDANKEYVITTPKTPYPWINYLGTTDFFSIITNTSGGYSFFKDARLRRITRYRYNNVPVDDGGKYFYINEGGNVWSAGWKPVKAELDKYSCRHGLGYTIISSEKNGLASEITYFVPLNYKCELQKVKLTNNTDKAKSFKLFSFVEWCLWNAQDDMTNFQRNFSTGQVEIKGSTLYHKTEYRERRNHYAFYNVNAEIAGFDTDRDTFLGLYNGFDRPDAVFEGKSRNSEAHGWSPIASHCLEVELKAGESKEFIFMLGYVEIEKLEDKFESNQVINKKPAEELMARFADVKSFNAAFDELKNNWENILSTFQIKHADDKLNRMVNIWNQYQCQITYNFSRSTSFFESGIGRGMGFRDSNQDLIGFVHQAPALARQRIIDIASTQFEDGSAYHQYQPLTKKGNAEIGGNFNDDPLWLILGVSAYIKESGDWDILKEKVPFNNNWDVAEPLFEHLTRSFNHTVNKKGQHGLPLIGRADWNDCLNLNCFSMNPDDSYQTTENGPGGVAESVFIGAMFVLYGEEYAKLCDLTGRSADAVRAREEVAKMKAAMDEHGWDGEWFVRAYDHYGRKIGSKENEEGKIFIESQGFGVMAGIGVKDGRAKQALESVNKYLACDYGIVLNNPAFSKYYYEYGEISSYPEGYKENAGIFCHNNPWIMIAETVVGNGDRAFDYYTRITPAYLEEISDLHKTEPYVYSQMIAGKDAFRPGEAKNSWLTGTAAWNFYAIANYILGVRADYNSLTVDPCIPTTWEGFEVSRKFRGATYEISVKNPSKVSKGVKQVTIDGKAIEGTVIPVQAAGKTYKVEVIMG